ncbi:desulfoferrodoxin [Ruminococcaceae bacterium OttesenSCG-928-I18]|nr:desulfoferrodoxin [Ruminococcaceae bacterium OttesenSCG-928-I18]
MSEKRKYLVCRHCGNVVEILHDSGVPVVCCGEAMQELVPNTVDAAQEKHVPVANKQGDKVEVQVGSVPHPMLPEHYIGWIWLQTKQGGQRKILAAGEEPKAEFVLASGDSATAVYAWCNLHGLWKKEII